MANQNKWSLVRPTPPTSWPVTAEQMRKQSRVTISDDDDTLLAYIAAATSFAETYQNRTLLQATYRMRLDWFPSYEIKLLMGPIQSVTSVAYLDTAGNSQSLALTTDYLVDTDSVTGRITPAYAKVWPISRLQMQAVTITYVAGYTDASYIPATTLQAIKLLAAHWYLHREDSEEVKLNSIPHGAMDLLDCDSVFDFSGVLGSSNNLPGSVTAWGGNNWMY